MTQRLRNTGRHRWWQPALPITVASAAFLAALGWHYQNVWSAVPRAVAQTTDAMPIDPVPAAPDAAVDEAPDQPTDHVPAEARRRHVRAGAVWMQEAHVPPPVAQAPPLVDPALSTAAAPVDPEVAARVQGLLDQYERVRQAMPENVPPAGIGNLPTGPPRMDSGDPNPDRLQGAGAPPVPAP